MDYVEAGNGFDPCGDACEEQSRCDSSIDEPRGRASESHGLTAAVARVLSAIRSRSARGTIERHRLADRDAQHSERVRRGDGARSIDVANAKLAAVETHGSA